MHIIVILLHALSLDIHCIETTLDYVTVAQLIHYNYICFIAYTQILNYINILFVLLGYLATVITRMHMHVYKCIIGNLAFWRLTIVIVSQHK